MRIAVASGCRHGSFRFKTLVCSAIALCCMVTCARVAPCADPAATAARKGDSDKLPDPVVDGRGECGRAGHEQAAVRAEGRGPAHSHARIRYELSGDGDGPTLFEYINEFEVPGGRLGNVASRVIVGAASEREAKSSLARLKQLVERA